MSSFPSPPETAAAPAFVCDCDEWVRSACAGEAFYQEHEDKRYCVLHYPGKQKSLAFAEARERKPDAQDYDFSGVWFPDPVDFYGLRLSAEAKFNYATFSAVAAFNSATQIRRRVW
jgi:hypothetical protein